MTTQEAKIVEKFVKNVELVVAKYCGSFEWDLLKDDIAAIRHLLRPTRRG